MNDRRVFKQRADWQILRERFVWNVPKRFNIAEACCDSWAKAAPQKTALIHVAQNGATKTYTYQQLSRASNGLANGFKAVGMQRGDRCAVLLAQSPEVLITHFACYKLAMISLPLFTLFGEEALEYRLSDSGARVVVTDHENLYKILKIKDNLPDLQHIYVVGGGGSGTRDFWLEIERAPDRLVAVDTFCSDPAIIIYTSGTTGPPKGALHAHQFLLGHLPAVELQHEFFPQAGDVGWTPADWAWIGGLMNIAMACLYYGVPLVSHRMGKFDPGAAYHLVKSHKIRNMFLPPTALKMMRQINAPRNLSVRTVMSGGESLGAGLLDWGREALGVTINETYGQTECNLCLTSSAGIGVQKPGAIGKPVPGFDVAILDADGQELAAGQTGEIAVKRGTPAMFRQYWKQPQKTSEKFINGWLKTGDLACADEDGFVTFIARDDDVITSGGYRIGPTEIENCLIAHPDVKLAAVVGVPDAVRTEIVKAFVVLREGATVSGIETELIDLVRSRVSPHMAPKLVEIIDKIPMTATGKIIRKDLRARG